MFATDEWLEASLALFSYEKTVLGYTRVLLDTHYSNMVNQMVLSRHDRDSQIRMLASWDLPNTLSSIAAPDQALMECKLARDLLMWQQPLAARPFDGMIAKAIQALRYHQDYSFTQFTTSI